MVCSSHASLASTPAMPPSSAMRNVRDFLSSARRLVLDAEELVEHALPVRALVLEPLRRLGRLEQPQEERAQRCIAAYAAIRLALAQPAAHLGETDGP